MSDTIAGMNSGQSRIKFTGRERFVHLRVGETIVQQWRYRRRKGRRLPSG